MNYMENVKKETITIHFEYNRSKLNQIEWFLKERANMKDIGGNNEREDISDNKPITTAE